MLKMHSFQKAKQMEISVPESGNVSLQDLFVFLYEIYEWMEQAPFLYYNRQTETRVVYALFSHVVFTEEDFWQMFGPALAVLHTRWPIHILGTEPSLQETVCFSIEEHDGRTCAVQKTVSGQPAETVQGICLRIPCPSSEQAAFVSAVFQAVHWKKGIAAVDWKYRSLLEKEQAICLEPNSRFCYSCLLENTDPCDCLQALNFTQKKILWSDFLKNGFDFTEFEWLYNELSRKTLADRMEWELSLHAAMLDAGYTVQLSAHAFELYDGQAQRRYFSFNSSRYAERAFLKILFPLNL